MILSPLFKGNGGVRNLNTNLIDRSIYDFYSNVLDGKVDNNLCIQQALRQIAYEKVGLTKL